MISTDANRCTPYRDQIDGLYYEPWIGPEWERSDLRVFLLGDSHYDEDEPFDGSITHAVVTDHGMQGRLRFMNGCRALATGLDAGWTDPVAFWNRVGFSNLLQVQLDRPGAVGDPVQFDAGARLLPQVIELANPTHIILFGNRVWDALEGVGALEEPREQNGYHRGVVAGVPAFFSRHPSAPGFWWKEWSRRFGAFLTDTGTDGAVVASFVRDVMLTPTSVLLRPDPA